MVYDSVAWKMFRVQELHFPKQKVVFVVCCVFRIYATSISNSFSFHKDVEHKHAIHIHSKVNLQFLLCLSFFKSPSKIEYMGAFISRCSSRGAGAPRGALRAGVLIMAETVKLKR